MEEGKLLEACFADAGLSAFQLKELKKRTLVVADSVHKKAREVLRECLAKEEIEKTHIVEDS